ncbi:hypothetical protein M5K25_003504 [Dendrobium thyrsiflorum]|uniref:Uncharacterized protein n=1 Tax=Dendrobium thyrsiflorum TaxID=117978 RepID=A0ABD0VJE5_DENTH
MRPHAAEGDEEHGAVGAFLAGGSVSSNQRADGVHHGPTWFFFLEKVRGLWFDCVEGVYQYAVRFTITLGVLEHPFVAFVLPVLKQVEDFGPGDWGVAGKDNWVLKLPEIAGELSVESGEMEDEGEEE